MTHAKANSHQTVVAAAERNQRDQQHSQVAPPSFASVHGAAQAVVVVARKS